MTDLTTPLPELDANSIVTLAGGLAIVGIGLVVILQVPQAREACGRVLQHPEVKKAGRAATQAIVQGLAAAMGWRIEPSPMSV